MCVTPTELETQYTAVNKHDSSRDIMLPLFLALATNKSRCYIKSSHTLQVISYIYKNVDLTTMYVAFTGFDPFLFVDGRMWVYFSEIRLKRAQNQLKQAHIHHIYI